MFPPYPENDRGPRAYELAIDQMITDCAEGGEALEAAARDARDELLAGATLAQVKGISHEQCEAVYEAVVHLMHEGRHEQALPPALLLAAHAPDDARFLLAAGGCLQFTGQHARAIPLYGGALLAQPGAAVAFRLGECFAAAGFEEQALECFDAAVQLYDRDEDHHQLAEFAAAAAAAVRSGALAR